jgi:hypothetical protein
MTVLSQKVAELVELAEIYFEDGAPSTAIQRLREARRVILEMECAAIAWRRHRRRVLRDKVAIAVVVPDAGGP